MRNREFHSQPNKQSGFTMIELMLTVVFVLLGSQLIQGSFLRAADVFGRYSNTLSALLESRSRITQEKVKMLEETWASQSVQEKLTTGSKPLEFIMNITSAPTPNLFLISTIVSWKEGNKSMSYKIDQYAYQKKKV